MVHFDWHLRHLEAQIIVFGSLTCCYLNGKALIAAFVALPCRSKRPSGAKTSRTPTDLPVAYRTKTLQPPALFPFYPSPLSLFKVLFFDTKTCKMSTVRMMRAVDPSQVVEELPNDVAPEVKVVPPNGSDSGRTKLPPVCLDEALRQSAMTTEALSKLIFSPGEVPKTTEGPLFPLEVVPVSSASSTCTRDSDGQFSDAEGHHVMNPPPAASTKTPVKVDREVVESLNAKVSLRKTSRQGRSTQRWLSDALSHEPIRLVAGCVPILKGGKILLVSASRKSDWILPKGGWELDEVLEESAVRECFEEAGVLGILGSQLRTISYEPRKAKKRRLEHEDQMLKKQKVEEDAGNAPSPVTTDVSPTSDTSLSLEHEPSADAPHISKESLARIRGQAQLTAPKATDETQSVASTYSASNYSQVRLTFFALYVSEIRDTWPERGRLRKAVDIDEAIQMMESRPEFKAALVEVKERGLHIV